MKQRSIAKFDIKDLVPIALTLVVAGIGLTYGLQVVGEVKDDMGDCSDIENVTVDNFTYNASNDLCYNTSLDTAPNIAPAGDGAIGWGAANSTVAGLAKIPSKLPLIVTVIVAAIIIGILVRYLLIRFN